MPDDVEQGARIDTHAGLQRAGDIGHGSGTLHVEPLPYDPPYEHPQEVMQPPSGRAPDRKPPDVL